MTDFYYDGPLLLTASPESGQSSVWLKWRSGDGDLASSLVEALGLDEEALAFSMEAVEVHARVSVSFDPYRAQLHREGS